MFDRSVNKVILVGNLGADPEVKETPSGATVVNFNMATTKSWKNKSGEREKDTQWHNIVVWRGLADLVGRYVKKGNSVYVEGELQTRSWQDKDGNKRYITEIIAKEIQLLSNYDTNSSGNFNSSTPNKQQAEVKTENDDVPF